MKTIGQHHLKVYSFNVIHWPLSIGQTFNIHVSYLRVTGKPSAPSLVFTMRILKCSEKIFGFAIDNDKT